MKAYFNTNGQLNWEELHRQEWVQAMEKCPQEPDWHAEGNVLIHTKMVIHELQKTAKFAQLEEKQQRILTLAALFHDIGKPATTCVEAGRIVAPRHAKVGEKMTRQWLWDIDLPLREQICSLVRLHGIPLWSLEKDNPNATVIASSHRISNQWTWMLSTADVLGRICLDQKDLMERLEYFKELCLENECFDAPKSFLNEHSQFKFFYDRHEYPQYLYDDTEFEIILMCGIAGSGKDTFVKTLDLPVVSLDDLRKTMGVVHGDSKGQGHVIQKAYHLGKQYAAKKQSFVWNATSLTKDLRGKVMRAFSVYNPRFKIVYVETSMQNILKRRDSEIPESHLWKMQAMLDFPLRTEAHEVVYLRN